LHWYEFLTYKRHKIAWSDFEHWSAATMAQQGERHGWRRIKNRLERFSLTSSMMFAYGS
jgi:hypothetical protein